MLLLIWISLISYESVLTLCSVALGLHTLLINYTAYMCSFFIVLSNEITPHSLGPKTPKPRPFDGLKAGRLNEVV